MDEGDEVSNLWVTFTSENVAITFDGTTGYVAGGTIEGSVTTVAAERVSIVEDYRVPQISANCVSSHMEVGNYRCITVLNTMAVGNSPDIWLYLWTCGSYGHEIDRLVGENRDLRAHIGALEFEITRLCRELGVVITDMFGGP
ncbi:hypothetical protein Tco_0090268 [Tanacetum coccineum]